MASFRRLLARAAVDLVYFPDHARWRPAELLGARWAGVPAVVHLRAPPADGFDTDPSLRSARAIIGSSAAVLRPLRDRLPGAALHVVYPCIDFDRFDAGDDRRGDFFPRATPIVGFVGMFRPEKGIEYFLDMAAILRRQCPDVRYLAVGDESPGAGRGWLARMHRYAAEREVADVVHFAGLRTDIPEVMRTLDVLVVPSLCEGFGRVIVEANAVGVPVVAFDAWGIPEAVENGVTGVLVPPRDAVRDRVGRAAHPRRPRLARPSGRRRAGAGARALRARRAGPRDRGGVAPGARGMTAASTVVFVAQAPFVGGAERSLIRLAGALDRARYRPFVLVGHPGAALPALRAAGIEAVHVPLPPTRAGVARAVRSFGGAHRRASATPRRRRRAHQRRTGPPGRIARGAPAAPAAALPRALHLPRRGFALVAADGASSARCSPPSSPSAPPSGSARSCSLNRRCTVIPNGFHPPPPPAASCLDALRAACGFAAAEAVVGFVGRVVEVKGVEDFLHMAAHAPRPASALSLPDRRRRPAPGAEPSRRDGSAGRPPRHRGGVPLSSAFATTSGSSSISATSWSCRRTSSRSATWPSKRARPGAPLVATRVGGIPEIVRDGDTGVLVPASRPTRPGDGRRAAALRPGAARGARRPRPRRRPGALQPRRTRAGGDGALR